MPLLMPARHPGDEADHRDCELVIVVTTCKRADHLAAAADREGERPRIGGGGG
jgi:hypothetical protein